MIRITQSVMPGTHTPNDTCKWRAACEIDGVEYEAMSRRGASNKLARLLLEKGVPDDKLLVITNSSFGQAVVRYNSLHSIAAYTYAESAKASLRMGKYVDIRTRLGEAADAC